MNRGKHGFGAFALTIVAALGLMAFMAAGAQANWLYLEGNTAFELTSNELIKISKHTADVTLLIEGVNLSYLCQKVESDDFLLEPGTATTATALGTVLLSECVSIEKSTGKEQKNCNPIKQPIKILGKAKVVLHTSGQNYILLEQDKTEPLALIEVSELCALTEGGKLTGALVLECGELNGSSVFVQEDCKNHQVKHLLRQAPESLFPSDVLKYGTHKAAFDGIVAAELAGIAHIGQSWSGEV